MRYTETLHAFIVHSLHPLPPFSSCIPHTPYLPCAQRTIRYDPLYTTLAGACLELRDWAGAENAYRCVCLFTGLCLCACLCVCVLVRVFVLVCVYVCLSSLTTCVCVRVPLR